jgi:hypothetical protein
MAQLGFAFAAFGAGAYATAIFQGLNARYYFLRVALMKDYLRDTPQWVLDLQRSTVVG